MRQPSETSSFFNLFYPPSFSILQSLLTTATTASDVYDVLSALPRRKAPGLDGITTHLLRECARGLIASSLALLFNRSFSEQCFPDPWKDAVVVPVFKRGDRSLLNSYRPIALLSSVGKVCERIVYSKLYHFVSPILTCQQSGFRKQEAQLSSFFVLFSNGRKL